MNKLRRRPAYWTFHDGHGQRAYYFAPTSRTRPPYLVQREVTALIDIASDGTLAGVELVFGDLPPPPAETIQIPTETSIDERDLSHG